MKLNLSDVVRLRSGGPIMTIVGLAPGPHSKPQATVTWFDKRQCQVFGCFPESALQKLSSEPCESPPLALL